MITCCTTANRTAYLPDGTVERFDGNNDLVSSIDPSGNVINLVRDPANQKVYVSHPGDQQFAWPEQLWGQTSGVDGEANTNGLAQFNNYQAANACYYLTAHGKSDWYLPSPAEWNVIDPNRDAIGGFQPDGDPYWTSAEEEGDGWFGGIYHVIGSTFNGYTGQGIGFPIRCVRKD